VISARSKGAAKAAVAKPIHYPTHYIVIDRKSLMFLLIEEIITFVIEVQSMSLVIESQIQIETRKQRQAYQYQ
jgi:hypothetical protein